MKVPRLFTSSAYSFLSVNSAFIIIVASWIPLTESFAHLSCSSSSKIHPLHRHHHPYLSMASSRQLDFSQRVSTSRLWEQTRINNEAGKNRSSRSSPLENLNLLQKHANATPPGWLRRRFPNFPWQQVPNWLTYARCVAIPLLVGAFYQPTQGHVASAAIFCAASVTDYLDGYLARRWDSCSKFGAFLDPVADKLMVSTALILLSGRYGMVLTVPASIILARELAVSALREWMAQIGARDTVKVGWQGKCKTALTMVALTVLLAAPPDLPSSAAAVRWLLPTGLFLTYTATILTATSGWVYFAAAAPYLMETEKADGSSSA